MIKHRNVICLSSGKSLSVCVLCVFAIIIICRNPDNSAGRRARTRRSPRKTRACTPGTGSGRAGSRLRRQAHQPAAMLSPGRPPSRHGTWGSRSRDPETSCAEGGIVRQSATFAGGGVLPCALTRPGMVLPETGGGSFARGAASSQSSGRICRNPSARRRPWPCTVDTGTLRSSARRGTRRGWAGMSPAVASGIPSSSSRLLGWPPGRSHARPYAVQAAV